MFPPWYHRKLKDSQKHVTMNCFNSHKYKKQKWKRRIFFNDFSFLFFNSNCVKLYCHNTEEAVGLCQSLYTDHFNVRTSKRCFLWEGRLRESALWTDGMIRRKKKKKSVAVRAERFRKSKDSPVTFSQPEEIRPSRTQNTF